MLKALCFDLDGTLLKPHKDFQQEVLSRLSKLLSLSGWQKQKFEGALAHILVNEHIAHTEEAVRLALKRSSLTIPDQLFLLIQPVVQRYGESCELADHSLQLLDDLKSKMIPLALISNGPFDMQMSALNHTRLSSYFQTLLISGDPEVNCRKPDEEIFKLACSRLNVQAKEALMIGDNPLSDCKGALNAGLSTIQLGMRKPRLAKVKLVATLLELHDFLKTLF